MTEKRGIPPKYNPHKTDDAVANENTPASSLAPAPDPAALPVKRTGIISSHKGKLSSEPPGEAVVSFAYFRTPNGLPPGAVRGPGPPAPEVPAASQTRERQRALPTSLDPAANRTPTKSGEPSLPESAEADLSEGFSRLGWWFNIQRRCDAEVPGAPALATWEAGLNGLAWLNELVSKGAATSLGGDGYPLRYTVSAGVLTGVLANGIPKHDGPPTIGDDYYLPGGRTGRAKLDLPRLQSLDPDEIVLIEAWDLS